MEKLNRKSLSNQNFEVVNRIMRLGSAGVKVFLTIFSALTAAMIFMSFKILDKEYIEFDSVSNRFIKTVSSQDTMEYREHLLVPSLRSYLVSRETINHINEVKRFQCVFSMSEGEHKQYFYNKTQDKDAVFWDKDIIRDIKILKTYMLSEEERIWQIDFDMKVYVKREIKPNVMNLSARLQYEWREKLISNDNEISQDDFICNPGGIVITEYRILNRE